jgi:hypothetical protein
MTGKVEFTVGGAKYSFEMSEGKDVDLLHKLIVFGNPPSHCTNCDEESKTVLDTNKDKEGNTYINVRCTACGAKAKLGLYKTGGFFWHNFELYNKKKASSAQLPN